MKSMCITLWKVFPYQAISFGPKWLFGFSFSIYVKLMLRKESRLFQTEWLRLPSDCPNILSQKDYYQCGPSYQAIQCQKFKIRSFHAFLMKEEHIMMLVGPSVWSILIVVVSHYYIYNIITVQYCMFRHHF